MFTRMHILFNGDHIYAYDHIIIHMESGWNAWSTERKSYLTVGVSITNMINAKLNLPH